MSPRILIMCVLSVCLAQACATPSGDLSGDPDIVRAVGQMPPQFTLVSVSLDRVDAAVREFPTMLGADPTQELTDSISTVFASEVLGLALGSLKSLDRGRPLVVGFPQMVSETQSYDALLFGDVVDIGELPDYWRMIAVLPATDSAALVSELASMVPESDRVSLEDGTTMMGLKWGAFGRATPAGHQVVLDVVGQGIGPWSSLDPEVASEYLMARPAARGQWSEPSAAQQSFLDGTGAAGAWIDLAGFARFILLHGLTLAGGAVNYASPDHVPAIYAAGHQIVGKTALLVSPVDRQTLEASIIADVVDGGLEISVVQTLTERAAAAWAAARRDAGPVFAPVVDPAAEARIGVSLRRLALAQPATDAMEAPGGGGSNSGARSMDFFMRSVAEAGGLSTLYSALDRPFRMLMMGLGSVGVSPDELVESLSVAAVSGRGIGGVAAINGSARYLDKLRDGIPGLRIDVRERDGQKLLLVGFDAPAGQLLDTDNAVPGKGEIFVRIDLTSALAGFAQALGGVDAAPLSKLGEATLVVSGQEGVLNTSLRVGPAKPSGVFRAEPYAGRPGPAMEFSRGHRCLQRASHFRSALLATWAWGDPSRRGTVTEDTLSLEMNCAEADPATAEMARRVGAGWTLFKARMALLEEDFSKARALAAAACKSGRRVGCDLVKEATSPWPEGSLTVPTVKWRTRGSPSGTKVVLTSEGLYLDRKRYEDAAAVIAASKLDAFVAVAFAVHQDTAGDPVRLSVDTDEWSADLRVDAAAPWSRMMVLARAMKRARMYPLLRAQTEDGATVHVEARLVRDSPSGGEPEAVNRILITRSASGLTVFDGAQKAEFVVDGGMSQEERARLGQTLSRYGNAPEFVLAVDAPLTWGEVAETIGWIWPAGTYYWSLEVGAEALSAEERDALTSQNPRSP
jgi:hypothetical protein